MRLSASDMSIKKKLFDRCDETNVEMSSFCKLNLGNDMTRPPLWGSLLLAQYPVTFFINYFRIKKKFNCSLNNFCRIIIFLYSGNINNCITSTECSTDLGKLNFLMVVRLGSRKISIQLQLSPKKNAWFKSSQN